MSANEAIVICPQCGAKYSQQELKRFCIQCRYEFSTSTPPLITAGQNINHRYRVINPLPLETCNFYEVALVNQPQVQQPTHLVREIKKQLLPAPLPDKKTYLALANDSGIPHVWTHVEIFYEQGKIYTVLAHPGSGWRSLARGRIQSLSEAWKRTQPVGTAVSALNELGYGGFPPGLAGREGVIIVNDEVFIADLIFIQEIQGKDFNPDAYALADLLYYLHTGAVLDPEAVMAAPQVQPILRQAAMGGYPTVPAMITDIENSQRRPVYRRPLHQSLGKATHIGQVHDHNEDFVGSFYFGLDQDGATNAVGLYIVADGMGGHAAGEVASRGTVQKAFASFIQEQILPGLERQTKRLNLNMTVSPTEQLESLIQQANQLVYQANQQEGSNRGTTITVALIIGSQAFIANVGDSRIYQMRGGILEQITDDHSLVYSLYKAGQISKDEMYTHPQKNQIHRSLGDKETVVVDTFIQTLGAGDKLLLCSDGLWEMVRDPIIQQIINNAPSPQFACDQLIEEANINGGEDNISAIIINLE